MATHARLGILALLLVAAAAPAQLRMGPATSPGGAPVLDPPRVAAPSATDVLAPPDRAAVPSAEVLAGPEARGGQQHWVSLGITTLQPTTARVGVKVWDRPNGSLWLEAYGGSELFAWMYGLGARMQYTVKDFGHGDQLMISPGVGAHILPDQRVRDYYQYNDGYSSYSYWRWSRHNTAAFLVGDVDISWLHDFSPHFGFEVGFKLGLAVRVSGQVNDDWTFFPKTMFNSNLYPIVSFYYGLRF